MARNRRWGDDDKHFGPFTFAWRESFRQWAIVLSSGDSDENPGCCLRLQAFGGTLICEMPQIIKPSRRWVDTSNQDWGKPGSGYWDEHKREYGASLNDGHLHVKFGAQTMDSRTDQDWGCFLPWTQWRVVSNKIEGVDADLAYLKWDDKYELMKSAARQRFLIEDYDGERIVVRTYMSRVEWRLGTGWFKWLGYLWKKKVHRGIDIQFDKESGPEKGSWKGGLIGHSFEATGGETSEHTFRRYCEEEHRAKSQRYKIKFLGVAPATKEPATDA